MIAPTRPQRSTILRLSERFKQPNRTWSSLPLTPNSIGLLKAARELKLTAMMLGGGMIGPQVTGIKQQLGASLNNLVCWDVYAPEPTMNFPGIASFLDRYRAAAAEQKAETLGLYAPPLAYARMQVLERAVGKAGSLDQAAIGAALHDGVFPTIVGDQSFNELGEWRQIAISTFSTRESSAMTSISSKRRARRLSFTPSNTNRVSFEWASPRVEGVAQR